MTVRRYTLTRIKLLRLLDELKAESVLDTTLCIPPSTSEKDIDAMLKKVFETEHIPPDLPHSISASPTGAFLFWSTNHWYLIMPPFPVKDSKYSRFCEIEPLYSLLQNKLTIGLIMVRLGEYGLGVFRGDKLLAIKVGTGLVHSRHRKGGSSSRRFERHREKQMEIFFLRICEHVREQFGPFMRNMDYLLYGGAPETVLAFRKRCRYLGGLDDRTLSRLLDIKNPRQKELSEAFQTAWSSHVLQWNSD